MSGPSCYSKITNYRKNPKMDTEEVLLKAVRKLAQKYKDKKVLAIGCGDSYVETISKIKDKFPENVIAP